MGHNVIKVNIPDCKVSSKVDIVDGFQPFLQVVKRLQAQLACVFLKRLANNANVSEGTRSAYNNYFDMIIKVYENKAVSNKSMDFFLKKKSMELNCLLQ